MIEDITLEKVKSYIGIDYDDDDENIKMLIPMARTLIDSKCGIEYKENARLKELSNGLMLLIISQMYDNRSFTTDKQVFENPVAKSIVMALSYSEGDIGE